MQLVSYSDLENSFNNKVRNFESIEWNVRQQYQNELQTQIKAEQDDIQKLHQQLQQMQKEFNELNTLSRNEARTGIGNSDLSKSRTDKEDVTDSYVKELELLRSMHRSDQDAIIALQDRVSRMLNPSNENSSNVVPSSGSADHSKLLLSYINYISKCLKEKDCAS